MFKVTHTPEKNYEHCFTIEGDDIDELITECLKRIRPKSMAFYEKELRQKLSSTGKAIIDIHAGQKNSYSVKYTK
jgi:hypothetical protein